ncbi:MAG: UDP-glucose 4-epimerase GalE [Clostridia bacterium]
MKILVTGGAGYIGSHTCVELLNSGKEIIVVDNFSNSNPESLKRVKELTGKDFKFYEVDVKDLEKMDKIFAENEIDSVIHFAGYKAVGESVAKPVMYYENNLGSTFTLLKVMKKHGCNKLVFSSSATVYGNAEVCPLTEDMPLSTTNPYGATKLMQENILKDVAVADKDFATVILRYFNPIGAHKSGRIGENPNGIPNNLMPYVTQVAVGKREKLSVFGADYNTKDGTGVRDYIHVVDLAKGHVKAIEKLDENIKGAKVYNIGTGIGYSVLDIVKTFEEVNNVPVKYEIVARRPGDIATCYADASLAKKELNWSAELSISDMCKDAWNFQKNNPQGY